MSSWRRWIEFAFQLTSGLGQPPFDFVFGFRPRPTCRRFVREPNQRRLQIELQATSLEVELTMMGGWSWFDRQYRHASMHVHSPACYAWARQPG